MYEVDLQRPPPSSLVFGKNEFMAIKFDDTMEK